ncbi:MAG TPA: Pr6Pr family membrane protein [Luteimonas sp.]|nr:Pr6Pr family membrane protein [Luteimonas sp.]HRP71242.1 Pr6Pr family membrane protein [Luteimonas sp.]
MADGKQPTAVARAVAGAVAIIVVVSLALQYVLLLQQAPDGAALATLRFLSYFTVLSNLLVAAASLAVASGRGGFFASPRTTGAAALYIAITGLVYALVLRQLWAPQGLQWWADIGLHYAVPLAYLAWWALLAPHGALGWRDVAGWLLFPLAFFGWTLARGAWLSEYPYPFIDVGALGLAQVLVNAGAICIGFVVVGLGLVAVDRLIAAGRARKQA